MKLNGQDVSDLVSEYMVIHKAGEVPELVVKFHAINASINGRMIPELPEPWNGLYVLKEGEEMTERKDVLRLTKELKETQDIKEAAQLLSSGNWIAISATMGEPVTFCLAKVSP